MKERKKQLRNKIREYLRSLDPERIEESSRHIRANLAGYLLSLSRHRTERLKVAIYAAEPGEIDLVPLMEMVDGVDWYFPRCKGPRTMDFVEVKDADTQLKPGYMGLREPEGHRDAVDPSLLDVVITPGLAFTREGCRLGKGGGFYDCYLAQCSRSIRIGVALQGQLVADIPTDAHDQRIHHLLSEDDEPLVYRPGDEASLTAS